MNTTKLCKHCQIIKPLSDFYFRLKQQVYDPYCRDCKKLRARERYSKTDKSTGPKPKQIYSEEIKNLARQMHQDGKGYIEIGRLLKIRRGTIRAWCDEQYRKSRNILSKQIHAKWYANPENRLKNRNIFKNKWTKIMNIYTKSKNVLN